jgi:hypothetical protein
MAITINGNGTVTGISVGGLPNGIVDTDMLAAGAVTGAKQGAGSIVQVLQATETDVHDSNSASYVDVPGLSVAITPASSSSKFMIFTTVNCACNSRYAAFRLLRDSTHIGIGDAASNRHQNSMGIGSNSSNTSDNGVSRNRNFSWLDSPSTASQITYKLQWSTHYGGTAVMYLNRNVGDADQTYSVRCASTLTVMEVAG